MGRISIYLSTGTRFSAAGRFKNENVDGWCSRGEVEKKAE